MPGSRRNVQFSYRSSCGGQKRTGAFLTSVTFCRVRDKPYLYLLNTIPMSSVPLTKHGAQLLKDELHHLKTKERQAVIKAIAEARAHGDLSENADYDAAKERQGFVEGRIADLEGKLGAAQIIDPATLDADGRVVFASTVDLEDLESGDKVTYQIVGTDEADIKMSKVSVTSPIARALIGKTAGDVVGVQAPSGIREYEILEVRYI
ncbi:MAG: greA [Collimonas fungivorans]|nr:greA [Collimonas fungivorans]